jgi:hypothetical protein
MLVSLALAQRPTSSALKVKLYFLSVLYCAVQLLLLWYRLDTDKQSIQNLLHGSPTLMCPYLPTGPWLQWYIVLSYSSILLYCLSVLTLKVYAHTLLVLYIAWLIDLNSASGGMLSKIIIIIVVPLLYYNKYRNMHSHLLSYPFSPSFSLSHTCTNARTRYSRMSSITTRPPTVYTITCHMPYSHIHARTLTNMHTHEPHFSTYLSFIQSCLNVLPATHIL